MRHGTSLVVVTAGLLAGCMDLGRLLSGAAGTIITHPVGTILPATRPVPIPTAVPTPLPVASPSPAATSSPTPVATPRPTPTPQGVFPVEAVVTNDGRPLAVAPITRTAVPTVQNGYHQAVFHVGDEMSSRRVQLTLYADVPLSSPELSKAHIVQAQLWVYQPVGTKGETYSSFVMLFQKTLTDSNLTVSSSGGLIAAHVTIDFKGHNGFGLIDATFAGLRLREPSADLP